MHKPIVTNRTMARPYTYTPAVTRSEMGSKKGHQKQSHPFKTLLTDATNLESITNYKIVLKGKI